MLQHDNLVLLGTQSLNQHNQTTDTPNTAWDYYNSAPAWQKQIWGTAQITKEKLEEITKHLLDDNIDCAGDGSVKRGRAAQAWCIFRKDTYEILLKGTATVNGDYDHTTSLRPETISCVAAGSLLNLITASHSSVDATVTFFSDNESSVINSARTLLHDIGSAIENDIDVTIQNIRLLKKSKFTYQMMHVHGHQDNTDSNNLTPIAKINVHMDELVGQHIENVIASTTDTSEPTLFPSQQVSIVIDKNMYTHISKMH